MHVTTCLNAYVSCIAYMFTCLHDYILLIVQRISTGWVGWVGLARLARIAGWTDWAGRDAGGWLAGLAGCCAGWAG